MSTILAYSSPAAGHTFPMVPGLLELQRRGHRVHLRTAPDLAGALIAAGLPDVTGVDPRASAITVSEHEERSLKKRMQRSISQLLSRAPYELADTSRLLEELDVDYVLCDGNAHGAILAAEASGLPHAIAFPTLLPMPGERIPPYGMGLQPLGGPLGRLRDAVGWRMANKAYSDVMLPHLNPLRRELGLREHDSALDIFARAERLLQLTGAPLEYPRADAPANVRFCGAQNFDPPAEVPGWLAEDGDPWVLVTCSTDYQGDEELVRTAIEALRDEPVRVVVTLADAHGADLPSAPNVRVERFLPHAPVLERAAAVICPGGMGLTHKAVGAGVPLVVVPFGRDQPEVAARVVHAGAGVALPKRRLSPARLRKALHEALARTDGARKAGALQRQQGGGHRVADEVEAQLAAAGARRPAALRV